MSKYTIISGSSRNDNQSIRVASLLARSLREASTEDEVFVLDLSEVTLPQWHEGFWSEPISDPVWAEVSEELTQSDGIILVCPEWNGIVPPPLLNVFLLTSRGELAHKPGLIVTVSANMGGAYPVALLRGFASKNTQICFIPDHLIIRNVSTFLENVNQQDQIALDLRDRIEYSLGLFVVYAAAFKAIRQSGAIDLESFPYGM